MIKYFFIFIILLTVNIFSQFASKWNSQPIDYSVLSGWMSFDKSGDTWKSRHYTLDSLKFQIMNEGYNQTPQYVYTFTEAEKLAGYQIYSLGLDLTGDSKTEFYVLGYSGSSTSYRQSFKIIDITSGNIIFSKDDANFYFSYPLVWDIDGDGSIECLVTKFDYPNFASYSYEVYVTGVTSAENNFFPLKFEIKQNFPNPFNPSTQIDYTLKNNQHVLLQIFDIKGELVKTLVNQYQTPGNYNVVWDGTDNLNVKLSTGIYFYRISADENKSVKKMILLK